MLKMLRQVIGEDIGIAWLPKVNLHPVKMDTVQIDQILTNLLVNARDAITNGGKIIIETKNVVCDAAYCAAHGDFAPGEYVMLSVGDNGCGMDKQTQRRIFEPFFTTKVFGKGTGLGLATVYGIVKQNYGFINVCTEPGQGTTFEIYIPRHAGGIVEAMAPSAAGLPQDHGETVLLVEDELEMLNMGKMMLEKLSYNVLIADTPGKAMRLLEEHAGKIDLLLTDVVMPEMNGHDLAKRLLAKNTGMKCLFMSGYTADIIASHGVLKENVQFVQKPFSMKDLAAKMREALDE
jgi:CheY-like chemotaxis protein